MVSNMVHISNPNPNPIPEHPNLTHKALNNPPRHSRDGVG